MSDIHESILHELADSLFDYFEGSGAVNYIEQIFECKEDSSKSFVLTMQKTEGLTPCQKLAEANEEIKKLKAENAELKKQSQWISVEDELPINSALQMDSMHKTINCIVFNGHEVFSCEFSAGCTMEFWSGFSDDTVTHWMPLPTPPEGE